MRMNRWMTAMTLFVVLFYSVILVLNSRASRSAESTKVAAEKAQIVEKLKVREETARANLLARPELFSALSLSFMAVFFWGLWLDGWLILRLRRGRSWLEARSSELDVCWGARDVAGGLVFLLFVEACFSMAHEAMRAWTGSKTVLPDAVMFAVSLLRDLAVVLFVWALIKARHGRGLQELGLRFERTVVWARAGVLGYIGVIPLLVLTFAAVAAALDFFSVEAPPQNVVQSFLDGSTSSYLVPLTVFVALLGPALEELFFRGFAYAGLRKRFGVWGAACVSSAVFATMHMNLVVFAPVFLLGMFLTYLYESSGSLVPSIIAHMLHNGIMVALTLGFKSLSS